LDGAYGTRLTDGDPLETAVADGEVNASRFERELKKVAVNYLETGEVLKALPVSEKRTALLAALYRPYSAEACQEGLGDGPHPGPKIDREVAVGLVDQFQPRAAAVYVGDIGIEVLPTVVGKEVEDRTVEVVAPREVVEECVELYFGNLTPIAQRGIGGCEVIAYALQ
jgi:hypothetical protein